VRQVDEVGEHEKATHGGDGWLRRELSAFILLFEEQRQDRASGVGSDDRSDVNKVNLVVF
jgi:hypothetical protein